MIIQQPLEIRKDGKGTGLWHMTERSDESSRKPWPVGYCAKDCPGHATAEEAVDHYRHWQADQATIVESKDTQKRCEICGVWTTVRMQFPGLMEEDIVLCGSHCTKGNAYDVLVKRAKEQE